MSRGASAPTTVYYDGACPICVRDMQRYSRRDRWGRLSWHDVSRDAGDLAGEGVCQAYAQAFLHIRRPDGTLVRGAAGFFAIWRELPGYRWLAPAERIPGVVWLAERLYRLMVRRRLQGLDPSQVPPPPG